MSTRWFPLKFVILALAFTRAASAQEVCNNCCTKGNHIELDNSRRSVQAKWTSGQIPLCDKDLKAGWYRFTSFVGGKMPTKKVDVNHCGTQAPIWLNGNHPSLNDPVVRVKACVNIFERRRGCFFFFYVSVKHCPGNYYVYFLKPTRSCYIAYCAGNGKPCPYGQLGTSLATCNAGPQKLASSYLGPPVVTFKQPNNDDSDVIDLLCIVSIDAKIRKWKNVTYQIDWYSDGKHVKQEQPFCSPLKGKKENDKPCPNQKDIRSILSGGDSSYEPGQLVTCEVKAKFTGTHPWSDAVSMVKPFFAGIKVHPTTLIIEECKEPYIVQLTLTPTIPVRKNSEGLYVYVTFYLPDGLWLVNNKDKCIVEIKETQEVKVSIGATCTTLHGLKNLKVISPKIMNQKGFWSFYGLPTIWVSVFQKPKAIHKCRSAGDPHYRLLDVQAQDRWEDFMGDGDFVLYHNKEKSFEVQTRQWFCNYASITCNCGALIRDHNDVIKFSCCGTPRKKNQDSTTPIEVVIPGKKCLAPGISVKQLIKGINSKYEVIVPSGIRVIIERYYWGLDLTIYAPRTASSNDEEGLCLYRNKALDGDMNTYGYRYRKQPSYFDQPPPHTNINTGGLNYERSCPCDEKKDKEKKKNECVDGIPVYVPAATNDKLNRIKMCDRNPQKRDVEGSDDLTDEDFALFKDPSDNKLVRRMKRSITPVSKDNATRYCAEKLAETQVGKLCAKLGANIQALVNVCSSDIEFTGDFTFAIGAASLLMTECNDVIIQNITVNTNTTNSTSTETLKIPPIVEEISELLCPNDCAFNGKCVNGSCVCNKDYTAKDCSISVYQRPDISRLQTDGLCDRRKRRCKKVSVLGTGYLNSTNVTCHVEEMEVVNSSWTPNKNETKYPGIMTDLVLVECHLPNSPVMSTQYDEKIKGIPAAGLMISVSNNGIHKSKEKLKFISYDSVCMECNVSTGCVLKKSACFINRYCFAANEANPKDWCQQCLPQVDTNTWTKRQVNYPPNVTTVTDYYVVHGERLELPIEAIDPEGMPITVSLLEGSPKDAVVQNNILLWNVTTNKTTHFFFKVTDACQASATLNITITINVCQCNNSGQCVPRKPRGRGFYSCKCAPGFTGKTCDYEIDECESYPCLRGGCIDHVNNYSCLCDLGFEGRNCDIDINYCKSSPCSKGNCTDEVNGYTCNCIAGYTGDRCDAEIDECSSSPCLNNGTCTDLLNGYNCSCQVGYTGKNCDTNIDECQSSPCINGTCSDKVNGFSCVCEAGFTGMTCNLDINECLQASCANGTCVDKVNNYSCICNAGFTGRNCDVVIKTCSSDSCYPGVPCNENSNSIYCGSCPFGFTGDGKNCEDINDCVNHTCQNGGSCVDGINNFTCNCLKGYTGSHCQTDINDCVNHTCLNGGSCVDGVNNYTCRCVAGFKGDRCETNINDCVNHTCQNGGSCVDGINNFTCYCLKGYTGSHCQTDINDCVNHTCLNGGSCVDGENNYTCRCVAGFKGHRCETNINDCVNNTCQNGGSCVDGINNFTCNCLKGYTGSHCQTDINDCVNHTCLNGGSCVDGVNNYTCRCVAGFKGDRCETNINNCVNHTCLNGGSCVDGVNNYTCRCVAGFKGDRCETNINDCVNHPCQNGGSCVDGINNFTCNCLKGYIGSHCQTDISDCVNHTCLNGGSCVDGVNNYTCRCVAGFKGDHCETNVNECANHTCQNGGSCVDGINTFTCNCLKGYTGSLCKTDINDCVNHKCLNGGSCVDGENNYTCSCAAGFTGNRCETNIDDCISVTCNNGGTCEDGIQSFTCVCPYGYTGKFCDTELPTKSSESTTEPAQLTTDEVSEEQKTDFTFEVRVNEEWDDQLKDENSEKYKKISTVLKEQIQRAYFGKSELQNVEIISFRKGSIVAEFKLTFKTSLTAKQAMAPLKQETADGKLGSLEVDSNSLKLKDNNQGGNKEEGSSKSSNLPLIIGVTCGAIVLIATIVISVVFHCRRSNPRDTNSDRMPAEGSGSKRERYELKPTDSKDKDIVSVEEKGISNEGME